MLDVNVIFFFFNQMVILYFCGHRCGMNVMMLAAVNSWGFWLGYFFPRSVLQFHFSG